MANKKGSRRSVKRRRLKKRGVYRVRNWPQYNSGLVSRGDVTLWLDEAVFAGWGVAQPTGCRGAQYYYSDAVIVTALTLQALFKLPLRGTVGFIRSLLKMKNLDGLRVPDSSTLCRRRKELRIPLPARRSQEPVHVVVDSTGCKLYGEGEWKVRQHGWSKRRTWRKLHIGMDEKTLEILAVELTPNSVTDAEAFPSLLEQVDASLSQVSADGGYDQSDCYNVIASRQQEQKTPIQVAIPPQRNARIWIHGNTKGQRHARDQNLRRIRSIGRSRWKEESRYHRRSLAETTMFRLKNQFGGNLTCRLLESQETEVRIRCAVLNKMIQMARPESYLVEAP